MNPKPKPKQDPVVQPIKAKTAEVKTTLVYAKTATGKPTEYLTEVKPKK